MPLYNMALLQLVLIATEKLVKDEPLDTPDVEALAEAYNRVNDWVGSGVAFPRNIYVERIRVAEKYGMEEEMV